MEEAKGLSCIMIGVVDCAVNGPGLFERPWRGVEKEQLEVEDIAAAGVQDVDAGNELPLQPSVDEVWSARYDVGPTSLGRPRSTSSYHKLFVVLAVLELVKHWVLRTAQVALQFGHGAGSCSLFAAFLEDVVLAAGKVYGQGRHTGMSVVDVKTEDRLGGFTCRQVPERKHREGRRGGQRHITKGRSSCCVQVYLYVHGTYAIIR